jgi:hypothetical protein
MIHIVNQFEDEDAVDDLGHVASFQVLHLNSQWFRSKIASLNIAINLHACLLACLLACHVPKYVNFLHRQFLPSGLLGDGCTTDSNQQLRDLGSSGRN